MQKSLFFIVLLCVCMTVQARKKVNHASDGEGGRPKVALVLGGGGAKGASAWGDCMRWGRRVNSWIRFSVQGLGQISSLAR